MKESRQLHIIVLLAIVILIEIAFVGCGSGSSGNSGDINYGSSDVKVTERLIFSGQPLSFTSTTSDVFVQIPKETINTDANILLTERNPEKSESKVFENKGSKIYRLTVTPQGESSYKKITTVSNPIKLEIKQLCPADTTDFYLGTRSSSQADWQYSKLENTADRHYTVTTRQRASITSTDIEFTFSVDTYTLGEDITIFYTSGSTASGTASGSTPINSIKSMTFSTNLPYLDLKFDENGEMIYNTDIVINSCMEASRQGSIFAGSSVKSIITFLTTSNRNIDSLQVVGKTTAFADQSVSDTTSGGGDKYTHTISFEDYPIPNVSGKLATYSFTLKLRNIPFSEFPESFIIKSIFTDKNPITYATEVNISRDLVLSYLKAVSPGLNDGRVEIGSNLVMKYIAHGIASMSVHYKSQELGASFEMPGTFATVPDTNTLTFYPAQPWPENQTITASATVQCCSAHGENGIRRAFFSFITKELGSSTIIVGSDTVYDPVTLSLIEPNPTENVPANTPIVFGLSDDIAWVGSYSSAFRFASCSHPLNVDSIGFDPLARTLTINTVESLRYNSDYKIVFNGLVDPVNQKYISAASFTFSTGDGVHGTASIVASDSSIVGSKLNTKPIFVVDFGKAICKSDYIDERKITQAFESLKIYKEDSVVPISQIDKNWITPYTLMQMAVNTTLEPNSTYKTVMGSNVVDFENVSITPFAPLIFTTLDDISVSLATPNPVTDVDIGTNIVIEFSEPIDWVSSYSSSINLFVGKEEIPMGNYSYDAGNHTLSMEPVNPLLYNASYALLIAPGLYNASTLQYIASNAFYFSTADGTHVNASVQLSASSIHNSRAILKPTVEVDFGGSVLNYNAAKGAIRVKKNGVEMAFTPFLDWSDNYSKLAITYTLEPNTTYTITLDEGVRTREGRFVDPFSDFTFTTLEDIKASIISPNTATNVATSTKLIIKFSDDIAWSGSDEDKRLFYFYRGFTDISSTLTDFVYATAPRTLTITPSSVYHNSSYTLQLDEGLVNKLTGQKVGTFTFYYETADGIHETATAEISAESLVGGLAALKPIINVDFKKKVKNISLAQSVIKLYRDAMPVGGFKRVWSADRTKVSLEFTTALAPSTEYVLRMENSTDDYEGIPIEPFIDLVFSTLPNITAELTTPAVKTDVNVSTDLVLTFSNNISWNQELDADKLRLWANGQELEMKSYIYSDVNRTLTMSLRNRLLHNASYTLRIMEKIFNNVTSQEVATAAISFTTADGVHPVASISLDQNSISDGLTILKPTLYVDLKNNVLASDLNKVKDAIKIYNGGTEVTTVYKTWVRVHNKLKLTFSADLEPLATYRVAMSEGVRDSEGVFIDPFTDFVFTTQNVIGLNLTTPASTTNVATSTKIVITFSSPIDWVDGERNKFSFKIGDTVLELASFTYSPVNRTLNIVPAEALLHNTTYTLAVKKGIKNNATQQTTAAATFEFTTEEGSVTNAQLIVSDVDKVNDLMTSQDTANGIEDILIVTPTFVVDFGRNVLNSNSAANAVRLYLVENNKNTEITGLNKNWINTNRQVQITCGTRLASGSKFKVIMDPGVRDSEGGSITPFGDYVFKTTPNGTGSKNNPFLVYTASQLDGIRTNKSAHYKLQRDISIATTTYISDTNSKNYGWKPIGAVDSEFKGGFDGDSYTIRGLSINRPNDSSVGLFGRVASATIKNVYLEEGIVVGKHSVGSLAGYAYSSVVVSCCNVSVNVNATGYAGGICGDIYSTNLSLCRNAAEVKTSGERAGGIVGWNNLYSKITVCSNEGKITAATNNAGGIAGYNNAPLINCLNTGIIKGYGYVGGIVGKNNKPARVERCISFGDIIATNIAQTNVGGIAGYNEIGSTVKDSIVTNETYLSGTACSGDYNVVFNYGEGSHLNSNHYYGSLADVARGVANGSNWSDNTAWNSLYWQFTNEAFPKLVGVP